MGGFGTRLFRVAKTGDFIHGVSLVTPGGGRRPVENMQKLLGETWNGEMSLFFLFVRFYWVVCGLVALTFYSTT